MKASQVFPDIGSGNLRITKSHSWLHRPRYDQISLSCFFDHAAARAATDRITRTNYVSGREHPVYRFFDVNGDYICEVRYGEPSANALQRGLWTHTKNAFPYLDSVTNGWIDYAHNHILVKLFSHALVSSDEGHSTALEKIKEDIIRLKKSSGL